MYLYIIYKKGLEIMKKRLLISLLLLCTVISVCACSPKKDDKGSGTAKNSSKNDVSSKNDASSKNESSSEAKTDSNDLPDGYVVSRLTGNAVKKEIGNRTPIAVMINNIKDAIPQSGISYADVLFEAYAEGGITRLTALYEDYENIPKIGSIRSCRTYYLYFAKEFEASYFHYGQSSYALDDLAKPEMRALSLMGAYSKYCYRSTDKEAPHNVYTTGADLKAAVEASGMSTAYPAGYKSPLKFTDKKEITLNNGVDCSYFAPGFNYNKAYFTYDADSKLYKRFQFDAPHIDIDNGDQLAFKNILVKFVGGEPWPNGTPNYDNTGSGEGIFITDGKAIDIRWEKTSETGATRYYYSNGEDVVLNKGKTYICYVEDDTKEYVVIN